VKPRGRFRGRTSLLVVGDGVVAAGLFAATVVLRREIRFPGAIGRIPAENVPLDPFPWLVAVGLVAIISLSLAVTRSEPLALVRERGGLLVSSLLSAGFLVVVFFALGRAVPRTILLLYTPILYVGLELWRSVAERLAPIGIRPVLVLGSGRDAERAALALSSGEVTGHRLLEWRPDLSALRQPRGGEDPGPIPPDALDVVFASDRPEDRALLVALIEESSARSFELWLLPGLTDVLASRVVTRTLGDLPLAQVAARAASLPARAFRRSVDLCLGIPLLLLALPVLGVVSALVAVDSRGPAWIRQRRVGLGGKVFLLWKVRTMRIDAETGTGPTLASPVDARLTWVGRWLRKGRFDELPQLFHVVSGEMSLIGPRPERPEFVEEFNRELPAYRLRHLLRPGLTGLAQVMGAYATKPDVKLRYDLGYLFHWTPLLDLIILIRTVSTVLKGGGV
jgi:exopolysaccharide biosynthesis polyprenyl glycosylphosphotransferase